MGYEFQNDADRIAFRVASFWGRVDVVSWIIVNALGIHDYIHDEVLWKEAIEYWRLVHLRLKLCLYQLGLSRIQNAHCKLI
jgi:hypothetical protein